MMARRPAFCSLVVIHWATRRSKRRSKEDSERKKKMEMGTNAKDPDATRDDCRCDVDGAAKEHRDGKEDLEDVRRDKVKASQYLVDGLRPKTLTETSFRSVFGPRQTERKGEERDRQ